MFTRRKQVKPVIAVPVGAVMPADLPVPYITDGSFLEKLSQNTEHPITIVQLTVEELIALVEKPHLFGIDVIGLVGVPGGRYDAVWSSYIAPLKRVSLDTLKGELTKLLASAASDAPESADEHAKRLFAKDSSFGVRDDDDTEPETFE